MKRAKFKGRLAKRLERPSPIGLLVPTHKAGTILRQQTEAEAKERFDRLLLLLDHYDINPQESECWFRLAYCLAQEFVPGFQYGEKRGRKDAWPVWAKTELALDVHDVVTKSQCSVEAAALEVSQGSRWGPLRLRANTVDRYYREMKDDKWWKVVAKARAYVEITGEAPIIDGWIKEKLEQR